MYFFTRILCGSFLVNSAMTSHQKLTIRASLMSDKKRMREPKGFWENAWCVAPQSPPEGKFTQNDIQWSKYEGLHFAWFKYDRLANFIKGEEENHVAPTKFNVQSRNRQAWTDGTPVKCSDVIDRVSGTITKEMDCVPSLLSLCKCKFISMISHDSSQWKDVEQLPLELIEDILLGVPPLVLEVLHRQFITSRNEGSTFYNPCLPKRKRADEDYDSLNNDRTRSMNEHCLSSGFNKSNILKGELMVLLDSLFNKAWEKKFKLRWPDGVRPLEFTSNSVSIHSCDAKNWQQCYWEAHMQSCLDEATSQALVPLFEASVADISMSETCLDYIGCKDGLSWIPNGLQTFRDHYTMFGDHVRYLRIRNILCIEEIAELLRGSRIKGIMFQGLRNEAHINNACKILKYHVQTLEAVAFNYCRISSEDLSNICFSLMTKRHLTHGIRFLSMLSSRIYKDSDDTSLDGFLQFLQAGRSLHSLRLCDNGFDCKSASLVFDVACRSESNLSVLEISDNELSGLPLEAASNPRLQALSSLSVLCLSGNLLTNKDVETLSKSLLSMPYLKKLVLSDNPIEDDGLRSLIPFFQECSEHGVLLEELKIENCSISSASVEQLLETFCSHKIPLHSLAISNNSLGSSIAPSLGNFLKKSSVRSLQIEDIGLGPSGFKQLQSAVSDIKHLVSLNISKNRGGWDAAVMLSKLISFSSSIRCINASYNFLCFKSLKLIACALHQSKGRIQRIDLQGNSDVNNAKLSTLFENFPSDSTPIVLLPSPISYSNIHDDDP